MGARPRTVEAATGRWHGILVALGVDPKFLTNRHGPCALCGGTDRWRWDDRQGSGSWFCSVCGHGDGLDLVMRMFGWGFATATQEVDRLVGIVPRQKAPSPRSEAQKIEAIRRMLRESRRVAQADPVWTYLNRRTGMDIFAADIRHHPRLRYVDDDGVVIGEYPAMLAVMRDINGRGTALHRTYLTAVGKKADVPKPKKIIAAMPTSGSSVRLSAIAEHIGIAEGLETAMAASMRFGVPTWAATNAVLLERWLPPDGVRKVTIMADNDASFTGQYAAYALAKRLIQEGFRVEVKIPGGIDQDWCDESI